MGFKKNRSVKKVVLLSALSFLVLLVFVISATFVYLLIPFQPIDSSIEAFIPQSVMDEKKVTVKTEEGSIAFEPEDATVGFIFYPGAKVEHSAYLPLAKAVSSQGVLCVVVDMPLNFSLIDVDAAYKIKEKYPKIEKWYIGGHSLGGYAASMHLEESNDEYEGLILLASYTSVDLSETDLSVLCMYGDRDEIMNKKRFDEGTEKLPEGFDVIVIEGGCHAYFGMYDGQDRDCARYITNEEQIEFTAECIIDFINNK